VNPRVSALFVHGGRTADGVVIDLSAVDGVIVELGPTVAAPAGAEVIDATGLLVLPGAIDSHVHFNAPGARADWEGWDTGSAAAAAGAITTVVDMPLNADPPTVDAASFASKAAAAAASSYVDFGLWGGVIPGNRSELAGLADAGVLGFKAFMSRSGTADFPASDDLTLYEAMGTIAELGLPFLLHAESDRITADLAARFAAEGRTDIRAYLDSRPPVAESEAIARSLELAAVTGCRLHVVHVSTRRGVELVQAARASGQDVTCEITAHHLILDEDDAIRLGAAAKCAPPLRTRAEIDALWELLVDDDTLFVVSDHSPAPVELKGSEDFFRVWGGIAGVQSTVELMAGEARPGGRLASELLPRVLAGAAADRFGLAGKGQMVVGMDADLALVEVGPGRVLARDELHDRHHFSPYVGRELNARVRRTVLRGEVAYRDGSVIGAPRGRLLTPAFPAAAVGGLTTDGVDG
jgi:allantoinase